MNSALASLASTLLLACCAWQLGARSNKFAPADVANFAKSAMTRGRAPAVVRDLFADRFGERAPEVRAATRQCVELFGDAQGAVIRARRQSGDRAGRPGGELSIRCRTGEHEGECDQIADTLLFRGRRADAVREGARFIEATSARVSYGAIGEDHASRGAERRLGRRPHGP